MDEVMLQNDQMIYTTKDVCKILRKNRATIQKYREAGLLKMVKLGRSFVTTKKELENFMDLLVKYDLDLSNPNRIILAGQFVRQQKSASCSRA